MFIQVHSRSLNVVLSFETVTPFDKLPVWRELRTLPLAEQEAKLRDPDLRRKLVEAVHQTPRDPSRGVGAEQRKGKDTEDKRRNDSFHERIRHQHRPEETQSSFGWPRTRDAPSRRAGG